MNNLITNKKFILGLGIFVVIIVFLLATGALKFKASVNTNTTTTTSEKNEPKEVVQQEKLASRATQFSDKNKAVTFSIKLPVGWSTSNDSRVDFVAGSLTPEKLGNGEEFTVNMNALIGPHESSVKSFADYQNSWKEQILAQYPSMEFVSDSTTKVNGMDVYTFEVKNSRPDAISLRQIQYVFYVDDSFALVLTGTVPDDSWGKYQGVMKESFESIEKVTSESTTPTP